MRAVGLRYEAGAEIRPPVWQERRTTASGMKSTSSSAAAQVRKRTDHKSTPTCGSKDTTRRSGHAECAAAASGGFPLYTEPVASYAVRSSSLASPFFRQSVANCPQEWNSTSICRVRKSRARAQKQIGAAHVAVTSERRWNRPRSPASQSLPVSLAYFMPNLYVCGLFAGIFSGRPVAPPTPAGS
jgi:hypothetical protein